MRTVAVEPLDVKTFLPFGFYENMIDPDTVKLGAPPIEFYRDMIKLNTGNDTSASFSICRVESREPVIDVSEYHSACGEGILPLDNDVLIHVAPATPSGAPLPLDDFRVFLVPKGTMVVLKPGVWHHAPFTTNSDPANVVIVLPERTYARDCTVVEHEGEDRIAIKG